MDPLYRKVGNTPPGRVPTFPLSLNILKVFYFKPCIKAKQKRNSIVYCIEYCIEYCIDSVKVNPSVVLQILYTRPLSVNNLVQ